MASKGKQISVIIAGATGSTGRNLVSRLVSHPDVSRVVALARHPIPVNRWTSVFPHLHSGDALRYLSVVPVDWIKVLADSSNIPASYVSDGVWRQEDEERERVRFLKRMANPPLMTGMGGASGGLTSYLGTSLAGGYGAGASAASSSSASSWASVSTVESAVGVRPVGYVKFTPRGGFTAHRDAADHDGMTEAGGSSGFRSTHSDMEKVKDGQAFLQQMLHTNFYTSVFSGHHVAINCLGTSHMLSSSSVALVDYELSIAFAKLIRLFNCMAHAEPTDDEERLLVETTSRELDSVLWGEIYAACYGKKTGSSADSSLSAQEKDACSRLQEGDGAKAEGVTTQPFEGADGGRRDAALHRMSRGNVATLRHFSQVSVRGASDRSPIPYLRAHGRRDGDLLNLFRRHTHTFSSPGIFHSLFLSSAVTHTVSASGPEELPSMSPPSSDRTGAVMTPAGGAPPDGDDNGALRLGVLRFGGNRRQAASSDAEEGETPLSLPLWRSILRALRGPDEDERETNHFSRYDVDVTDHDAEGSDPDAVARQRARLLLRRDVVKIWDNASITIWRPGVLARPRPRYSEWLFSLIERPVDVRCLAECIVDDITETLYRDSGFGSIGSVKIINGKSVSRRARMKEIEDGLDAKDTKLHRRFNPRDWYHM